MHSRSTVPTPLVLVMIVTGATGASAAAAERPWPPVGQVSPRRPSIETGTVERRYTSERISLSLKDADVRDVITVLAKLTGLNMVVAPEVRGSVTVELHDVPWDQAFELILEVNGLGWERDGNVVVIAPWSILERRSRR